jgi:hypothetical protein
MVVFFEVECQLPGSIAEVDLMKLWSAAGFANDLSHLCAQLVCVSS